MPPAEVFLSHSSVDEPFVTNLAAVLQRHSIPVWYSKTNIVGAQQWHDEIGSALERCDWFLLVLSTHSVDSMWVKRELLWALQQNHLANKVIPVLLEPCNTDKLSWVLPSLQAVNFTGNMDDGYSDLLRIWGIMYQP